MKAIKACYVGCVLTKIARLNGIYTLECAAQLSNIPMHCIGAEFAHPFRTNVLQDTLGTR